MTPVLLELINYHYKNTDLNMNTTFVRQGLVAALLNLISSGGAQINSFFLPFLPILKLCFVKWVKQFMILEEFSVSLNLNNSPSFNLFFCFSVESYKLFQLFLTV